MLCSAASDDTIRRLAEPVAPLAKRRKPVLPLWSLGDRPPRTPLRAREASNPKTSVTVSSEHAEIRRSTPCPSQARFVLTAAIALDWSTVPWDLFGTHSGRCPGRGRRTRGRVGPLAGRAMGFGHVAESGHWLDTRSMRRIPSSLKCFEPGWSLELKTDIRHARSGDAGHAAYRCRCRHQCSLVSQVVGCTCVRVVPMSKADVALLAADIAGRGVLV